MSKVYVLDTNILLNLVDIFPKRIPNTKPNKEGKRRRSIVLGRRLLMISHICIPGAIETDSPQLPVKKSLKYLKNSIESPGIRFTRIKLINNPMNKMMKAPINENFIFFQKTSRLKSILDFLNFIKSSNLV